MALKERDKHMKSSILPAERDGSTDDHVFWILETARMIRTGSRLIKMCAWCGRIENHRGFWVQPEDYLTAHKDKTFTHGICYECYNRIKFLYKSQLAEEGKLGFEIQ